jgi:protein SSD1
VEHLAVSQTSDYLQSHNQQMPNPGLANLTMFQNQQIPGLSIPQLNIQNLGHHNFQFPQGMNQQHLAVPNAPAQPAGHRRNQSAAGVGAMGPPPPPPSGVYSVLVPVNIQLMSDPVRSKGRENQPPRGRGAPAGAGHARRHSLALPEAKKAAEAAEQKRKAAQFQFPGPSASTNSSTSDGADTPASSSNGQQYQTAGRGRGASHGRSQSMAVGNGARGGHAPRNYQFPTDSNFDRRGSHGHQHNRSNSRNFDGNWRQPQQQTIPDPPPPPMGSFTANAPPFQPGHRARGSHNQQSFGSGQNFQFHNQAQAQQLLQMQQGQLMLPQLFGQGLSPMQIAQIQMQMGGQNIGLPTSQHAPQMSMGGGNQQQRKTLFTPYLPQSALPNLIENSQLVCGILRVNKKNRSDAYVTTTLLDADIFICGSKDRNRALEGDLVAVELLEVDDVWGQKREKEEKKKRKDGNDGRGSSIAVNDATTQPETSADGGIRRRGSLRQRPTQKKNDDVEVEGQSLLLMEEEEINDELRPLYAGHVVAVIERIAGQMFSGTLGLLRPSSQATKEKQEAERAAREGHHRHQPERPQERPKIVWFKPTDKRVPLIAIPTEQAPKDFVERHQDYANKIFVACIKRWPITSLHPFGTLVESLGDMGDLNVETDALLRDNNFGPDEFADAVQRSVGFEEWSLETDELGIYGTRHRRDFRDEQVLTISPPGMKELDNAVHFTMIDDFTAQVGIHVSDVAYFVKPGTLVDREAKKRGTAVYLTNRTVPLMPSRLADELLCLTPGEERYTVSFVFEVNVETGFIYEDKTWIGKGVIKSSGNLSYDDVDNVVFNRGSSLNSSQAREVQQLHFIVQKWRQHRFGDRAETIPSLRLMFQLDDENVPPENNIFNSSPAHDLVDELLTTVNGLVAKKIFAAMPQRALLRRHAPPNSRRLQTFTERMTGIGFDMDTSSSGSLQHSVFQIEDPDVRKGVETLLIKTMQRAKYFVAGRTPDEQYQHYALNLPLYTHFTAPSRRYADMVVHRQLELALADKADAFNDDLDVLAKMAEACNTKKDSCHFAQEQSVHIDACRKMDRRAREIGGDLVAEGIVICVYESAFDVLIPEWGFEKRVHCDQLPLKKAEFNKTTRLLELYWEKGVPSSAYIPEDEQPKNRGQAARDAEARRQKEQEDAKRRHMVTSTMSTAEEQALFDDEDDDAFTESMAGVSLTANATQSMPPSPTRNGPSQAPHRTKSDSRLSATAGDYPETKLTNKEKYLSMFTLREANGEYIQDVKEMTRVPIILKTDLSKSPP